MLTSGKELLILLLIVLLVFGTKRLVSGMKDLGKGVREFKKGMHEDEPEQPPARIGQGASSADEHAQRQTQAHDERRDG